MRVKMVIQIMGSRDGIRWPAPGGEVDLPDHEGAKLVAAGFAEVVAEAPKPERTKPPKAEKRG